MKPGYKQTEVGVIPEDWEVLTLAEHFRIYAGGDVPKDSLSAVQSQNYPIPIYANAITDNGLYGYTAISRSPEDCVTVTARGYLGHAGYRNEPFFPIVRLLVLEPTGKLDARFTAYAINECVSFAFESTGVPQLTAPQISKYSVAAPTTDEQRAIATALSDMDALLDGLDRLIAKKRDLKQAVMQQLLTGQTRLPGFSGEWEVKRFSKHASLKARIGWQALTTDEYMENGEYYLITGTDFIAGRVNWNTCHFVSKWRYDQDKNIQLENDDVLVTKDGTIGKVGFVEGLNAPATLNRGPMITSIPVLTAKIQAFVDDLLSMSESRNLEFKRVS